MHRSISLALLPGLISLITHSALSAPINVVATLPDFGAIAEEVGNPHVKVTTLTRGTEDAHFVDPRPSFIRVLNKADVLLAGGAELEAGWLPPLVQQARNAHILPGRPGRIDMSQGLRMLEVPSASIDRSQGDIHQQGNPHYWLDPLNGVRMAQHLNEVFARFDPDHAPQFQANTERFTADISERLTAWQAALKPLQGTRILTYHKTYEYFAERFGLVIVDQLEPLPGLEPSPSHITSLIPTAKENQVRFILLEPFRPTRSAKVVAKAIDAEVLVLPDKVGANRTAKDYPSLFDSIVQILSEGR